MENWQSIQLSEESFLLWNQFCSITTIDHGFIATRTQRQVWIVWNDWRITIIYILYITRNYWNWSQSYRNSPLPCIKDHLSSLEIYRTDNKRRKLFSFSRCQTFSSSSPPSLHFLPFHHGSIIELETTGFHVTIIWINHRRRYNWFNARLNLGADTFSARLTMSYGNSRARQDPFAMETFTD